MKRFKLGFRNRSLPEQVAICRRMHDCVCKLPDQHRAKVARHPVGDAAAAAAAAGARVEALRLEVRSAIQDYKTKVRAARHSATAAASALYGEIGGDATGLLLAGLEMERDKRPVGRPAAPAQLRATASELEGVVELRWKRPVRRCAFPVEMTRDPAATTGWQQITVSIRQSFEMTGLESGAKYWFRVAATNTQGLGPWSNPVCVRVK